MNRHIIIPLLFIAGFFSTAVAAASGREPVVTADSTQAKGRVTPGLLFETSQLRSTAAVSTADGPALAKNRQTNLTNSFAGQFTGLTLFQGSGEPGNDMASWLVRGIGSYGKPGYNTAKIFVDGFEVNADYIAYLSPAEIDKVSVLKDGAALSIFGDRGANGVIWIETKRGEIGPASVSASVHYGIQQATTYAKPLDSYGYATLYNQAVSNDNGSWSPAYDAAALEAYRNGSATNVDWYDEVLRDSGYVIDGDVTFRGGTQTARYNVVLNYLNQQGLFDVSNSDSRSNRTYERYGLRANLDFTMFKFIEARVDLGGRIERGKRPNITIDDLFYNMARYPSNIYEIWDDEAHTHYSGTSTYNSNPVASINALGWRQAQSRVLQGNFQLVERLDFITEGLYLREAFSFNTYTTSGYSKTRNYARYHNGVRTTTDEDTSLQASGYGSDGMEDWKQGHISLGYDRQFGRHAVDAAVTQRGNADVRVRALAAADDALRESYRVEQRVVAVEDGDAVGVDAGDGEQILHHPVEPLGVGACLGEELDLLLPAQRVVVVDDRRAGPVDGRQRGAQVVGDSPQEVGPHLLCLALHPQLLLLFDAGGQGARHKGDHQHHHAGEDVLRDGEVEGKVGRAEREVDRQHADDRTGHAPPVAVGVHGNKKHRQQEHHRGHTVDAAADELDERHTGERPDERRQKYPDVLFPEHLLHLLSLPIYIRLYCKSIPQIN